MTVILVPRRIFFPEGTCRLSGPENGHPSSRTHYNKCLGRAALCLSLPGSDRLRVLSVNVCPHLAWYWHTSARLLGLLNKCTEEE